MTLARITNSTDWLNGKGRADVGTRAAALAGRALLFLSFSLSFSARAQTPRPIVSDFNAIGWFVYQGDHKLGSQWEVHTEYQARRTRFVADWQQWLLRGGLYFKPMPRLKIGGGYAYCVTDPYGDHPIAAQGTFPEHRFYEDVILSDAVGYLLLSHRLRLEQRYVGIPGASGPLANEAVWSRQNRIRYQLGFTFPLQGPTLDDNEWFASAFEEVFLNFGRNVGANSFNQNRVAVGLGYQFDRDFRLELQYLNQIWLHGGADAATGLPVYEFNNGFRLALTYNLTFIEPSERPAERREDEE